MLQKDTRSTGSTTIRACAFFLICSQASRRSFAVIDNAHAMKEFLYGLRLSYYENENLENRESPDPGDSLAGLGGTSVEVR